MEENPSKSENLNDWEQVQSPSSADVEFKDGYIFPPNHHEGLPVPPPENPLPESTTEEADEVVPTAVPGGMWRQRLGFVRCGALQVAVAVGNFMRRGGVFWGFCSVAGVLAAAWVWARVRRLRQQIVQGESGEHLAVLIRERDEKIKQLLLKIAQMNEMLPTLRNVPVIRIAS